MSPASLAALVLGSALLAAMLTRWLASPGAPLSIVDVPNERSLHVRPTPRTGGVAIVVAVLLGWLMVALLVGYSTTLAWIALGAVAIVGVSFADDRGGVSAQGRLGVHLAGAALLIAGGLSLERVPLPGVDVSLGVVVGGVASVLFIVWMTNLYNFMDGMDGFAGGMSVSGFGFVGAALWAHGEVAASAAALVIAGSGLGFLRYNFPPARIFMGDVGAAPLGFVAAALMLHGDRVGAIPLWASILVFSPFIVDATVTLCRRALRGDRIWQAHRTHYYQRLVTLGWGHRRTVLSEYLVMVAVGSTALALLDAPARVQAIALVAWTVAYVTAMQLVARLERRRATS